MKVIAIVVSAVLVSWVSWHGCAGGSGGGGGGEAGGGPPGGGGGGGARGGGAAYVAGCPAAVPVDGKTCAPSGRICTYGTAPRGECRERATCVGGTWATRVAGGCAPAAASDCPSTVPAATACGKRDQLCAYPGGVECVCVGGTIGWQCDTPQSPSPDCPATPPNAGTACAGTTSCTYACGLLTTDAVFAHCAADGTWTWAFMPCANTNRTGRVQLLRK